MMDMILSVYFWYIVAFVLFFVLAWKPVGKALGPWLDDKAVKIQAYIAQARALQAEAQHLLKEAAGKLAKASSEASRIVAEAQQDAANIRKRAEDEIAATLKHREHLLDERIALMEKQAVASLRAELAELTVKTVQDTLAKELDAAKSTQLIEQAIGDLAKAA